MIEVVDLGLTSYRAAWELQRQVFGLRLSGKIPDVLLLNEHEHVYTLGRNADPDHLLAGDGELKEGGIEVCRIDRGGDITYHGPGQLVVYPVIDLENFFTDIHRYMRLLEEAVILTLAEYKIPAGRIPGLTGVWIDWENKDNARKICALGVKTSRWVAMHGLAFNVNTDLSYFKHIVPCGIKDKDVTSLQRELGATIDMKEAGTRLRSHLVGLFQMELS